MSTSKQQVSKIFNFTNRFLAGLIITMSLVLMAFEYTVERTETTVFPNPEVYTDGEELPPITLRKEIPEKPQPKPETKTDQIEIVEKLPPEKPLKKEPEAKKAKPFKFDPEQYGMNIPEVIDEPELPRSSVEVFPHTDACAGLKGKELKDCSLLDIISKIKERFVVPSILNDIGTKQGAQMKFVINEKGEIEQIEAIQSSHPAMSKASETAIAKLPTFIPPSHHGQKVKLIVTVPIVVNIK